MNKFNGVAFIDLPQKFSNKPNICRMNLLDMTFVQRRRRSDEAIWQAYMVGTLSKEVTQMPKDKRVDFFLKQMELIPEYKGIKKCYQSAGSHGTSRCWDEEKWTRGAYPLFRPGQMMKLMPHIASPEGRVFFAGDHTSGRPGWIEGALQSGHRVVKEIYKASSK
jgi:monoamine oxidase